MLLSAVVFGAALAGAVSDSVPLYDDLGTHHMRVATSSPQAQRYFDQGLRLVYGFNHGEAVRAFTRATELDPRCAMCFWGIAYAYGPHVNGGMDSAGGVAAYAAAQRAVVLAPGAPRRERAYIRALARRYEAIPPVDRGRLDSAYARAMSAVVRAYPNDLDAATLYAESLMNLRPWNYWTPAGRPYPGTNEIVRQLRRVIARNPEHPGACHYFIHAVEAVNPRSAVPCAERLARLMPGAGHIVHMPAHIYIRVGRYADAVRSNEHAIHTDEAYIEGQRPSGAYPSGYYPHNFHFLAFAAAMAGRSSAAIAAARALQTKVTPDVLRTSPSLQEFVPYHMLTLVTFGKWNDVLAEQLPPADVKVSYGMAQYARGVALAANGDTGAARAALDTVTATCQSLAADADGRATLEIATHALAAEIASRSGDLRAAIDHFRRAAALEDAGIYYEPPKWYYPVRHSLGAVLMRARRFPEAERAYREDLRRFPENGWSLFGLAQALRAQGRTAEAAAVESRFRAAWRDADVTLTASRF